MRNYLEASLNLFDKDYRSVVSLDITFSENNSTGKLLCTYDFTYEIFRVEDKFQTLHFANTKDQGGKLISLDLTDSDGNTENIDISTMWHEKETGTTGVDWVNRYYKVPEKMSNSKWIRIHRVDEESGEDHWDMAGYMCTQPVHEIDVKVFIPNGYTIKNKDFFLVCAVTSLAYSLCNRYSFGMS